MRSSFAALLAFLAVAFVSPAEAEQLRHAGAGYVLTVQLPDDWDVEEPDGTNTLRLIGQDDITVISIVLVRDSGGTVDDARMDRIARAHALGSGTPPPKRLPYSKVAGFEGAAYGSQASDVATRLTIVRLDPNAVAMIALTLPPNAPRSVVAKYENVLAGIRIARGQ